MPTGWRGATEGYPPEIILKDKNLGKLVGVKEKEINEVQNKLNLEFPQAYIEYLLKFGDNTGYLLKGYFTEFKYLEQNKSEVLFMFNTIISEKTVHLQENFLFFANWQGYNFFFFECNGNDNPPVNILNDSFEIFEYKKTFTDFILEEGLDRL